MTQIPDEPIKKLSEAIVENDEIITEVNSLIKEMKAVKDINDEIIEKYKKESGELIGDLDDIIEVMEVCQQADDPTLKSFDTKKKTAKSNSEKSKKQLLDALSRLEKSLQKNKDSEAKKTKGILKNTVKKDEEENTKKKTDKDKKKDLDTQSAKSTAGSSNIEDLEEVEEDLASEFEEENKHKVIELKGEEGDKKEKPSKDKKKEKDDHDINDKKDKGTDKKDKKVKETTKKKDDSKSESKNKDSLDDGSAVGEDEEKKKSKKRLKLKSLKLAKGDKKKSKENELAGDEKSKTTDDNEHVSIANEDSLEESENEEKEKKGEKKEKATSSKDKKEESLNEEKPVKVQRKKKNIPVIVDDNESNGDIQIAGDINENSLGKDKKKKDKKEKEKKNDDNQSLDGTTEDSKKKSEKKSKDKKSDGDKKKKENESTVDLEKVEESGKKKKNKDKSTNEKSLKKSPEKVKNKESDKEIVDSDKELRTPSIRTQESMKSESDFYEDFESDEEDNNNEGVIMRKAAKTESKLPESPSKPSTSQMKPGTKDFNQTMNIRETEGELVNSTTFENIDEFYVATKTVKAEGEDDLSIMEGEQLTILEINDDGWWLARNSKGDEGFVPMSCLKPVKDTREFNKSENVNDIEDKTIIPKEMKTESKEIPKEIKTESKEIPDESAQLWAQIQKTMKEKGITDVLKAFGTLPAGFRFSTLAAWYNKNPIECSMRASLSPKLSDSDLSFRDLQYDTVENKIRPRPVRIQRIVQIVKSFQMSATSDKFVTKGRHLRMCLFNGEKAISNIHTIRATVTDKDVKTWNFNSKITDSTNSFEFNEIFLRTNHSTTELSLLLEFSMIGFKTKNPTTTIPEEGNAPRKSTSIKVQEEFNDDELIEFSTGWTKIPLYDENGQLITNKNADYELFGGTPFEEGLEVDPSVGRTATGSKLKTLLNQSKQPQVSVRISVPNKENKDLMETLPDVIVGSTLHLTNLSFYRRILSEELMDRRQNLTSAEPIYSPFLVSFLDIADQPDLLDVLRTIWNDKMKTIKNLDKKDYGKMNKVYQDTYMEYIYPLSKIKSLQPASLGRQDAEQMRSVKIKEFVQRVKADKLSVLLSGDYSYAPLSFEEFSYKVVSKYSKPLKA